MAHVQESIRLDAIIFGGGGAGLWLLDELTRRGQRALVLEAGDLGAGQTIASQGIIHGGLKYSLAGLLTPAAAALRDMPLRWRRSLAGERGPDLRRTRLRAEFCHLWRSGGLGGRLGLLGARMGLSMRPIPLAPEARPPALASAPEVWRLDEQVIEPASFLGDLADQHPTRILQIDGEQGVEFDLAAPGQVAAIRLLAPGGGGLALRPKHLVFTAGAGNDTLRRCVGLDRPSMQCRPLQMVLARGPLPALNGHCVDGTTTRLTITTSRDCEDRTVWQVGGQIAERGATMRAGTLIEEARRELRDCLSDVDLSGVQWASYHAVRAEPRTGRGARPDRPHIAIEGNTITAWPTKLALVPALTEMIVGALDLPAGAAAATGLEEPLVPCPLARPIVALPPWERIDRWTDA